MPNLNNTELKKKITAFFKQHLPEFQALYLFGSEASGKTHRNSDIDVAILLPHDQQLTSLQRFDIAQSLANELNRDIDLIDLREASTVLRSQIISTGQRLCAPNPNQAAEFEMYTYADYAKLNEQRAEILKEIQQRGRVYD